MLVTTPGAPLVGQPLSKTWAKGITDLLRSMMPIAGAGMQIERKPNGTVFRCSNGGGSAAFTPTKSTLGAFQVRWFVHKDAKDDKDGEWQIYLPFGCAVIGTTSYIADKSMAKAKDWNGDVIPDWYKIGDPSDTDAFVSEYGSYKSLAWTVKVVFKPWPRLAATTDTDGGDFGIGIETKAVATIHEVTVGSSTGHAVTQIFTGTRTIDSDTVSAFAIEYRPQGDLYGADTEFKPFVVNQEVMLGRIQASIEDDTDISDWEDVCVKVEHSSTEFTMSMTDEFEESDDDKTVVKIYRMQDGVVKTDMRGDIDRMPFYND